MRTAILEGVEMGLLLSTMIGPVFFALITTSMNQGMKQASFLALGVFSSDLLYIFCTYFGIHVLMTLPYFEKGLGIAGGVILVGLGIRFFRQKVEPNSPPMHVEKGPVGKAFLQGFGINGINPFVFLFWLSIASMVSLRPQWKGPEIIGFYAGLLITIFLVDMLKAYLGGLLTQVMTVNLRKILNWIAGIMICYFGIKMIWLAFSP
ncbi:MAG: hypothetical protein RL407_2223 [Bacteroidota bacterium]|jgi:threonine/homoserine/homoserine lactone efflux protein|nr:LysE family translocator [Cyclobacteriaceae bacterium]